MSGSQQLEDGGAGTPVAAQPDPARAEVEARAKRMGWKPRSNYRGPDDRFIEADEYIERGERMLPLLQERNRAQDSTIQNLQRQVGQMTSDMASLVKSTRRAEQIGYNRARRELEVERAKAVADGDVEAFNRAERSIQDLGTPPPGEATPDPAARPAPAAPPPVDPAVAAFIGRNRWFETDPRAKQFAIAQLSAVQAQYPGDSLEECLDEVENRVRDAFPDLFERRRASRTNGQGNDDHEPPPNQRRRAAPMVTPSGSAPPRSASPRSFDAMPQAAKDEWKRQAKMLEGKGDPFTKEEYARYYWEAETGEAA